MTWFSNPVHLTGTQINLIPLDPSHFDELIALAKEKRIWQHYAVNGEDIATLKNSLVSTLAAREKGLEYPFVIVLASGNKIIGSTRFLDIRQEHRKLEIGWTWLHPDYWGTSINLECKLLLLAYCFEELTAARVQLKTDENNIRSRKAIEKIGATLEGILRNDMIRDNGTNRNSAYYSIISDEWNPVKHTLIDRLKIKPSYRERPS